jgi:hypothetical protein
MTITLLQSIPLAPNFVASLGFADGGALAAMLAPNEFGTQKPATKRSQWREWF